MILGGLGSELPSPSSTSKIVNGREVVTETRLKISIGGLLLIAGIAGIGIGLWWASIYLTRAVRGGPGETFELHTGGLVHRGWRVRQWTWQEMAGFDALHFWTDFSSGTTGIRGLACTILFADGTRLHVDRYTADGHEFARTVGERCKHVRGVPPARTTLVLTCSALVASLVLFGTGKWLDHAKIPARAFGAGRDELIYRTVGAMVLTGVLGLIITAIALYVLLKRHWQHRR